MTKKDSQISKKMKQRAAARKKKRQTQIALVAIIAVIVVIVGWIALDSGQPSSNSADLSLPLEISVEQAYEMYQAGAFVLDVRTPEEWDDYHAPNTTLIPLDELENRVSEVPMDQDVVVICRSGNRSQVGRDILLNAGFTQVTSADGGLSAWRAAGYPTE